MISLQFLGIRLINFGEHDASSSAWWNQYACTLHDAVSSLQAEKSRDRRATGPSVCQLPQSTSLRNDDGVTWHRSTTTTMTGGNDVNRRMTTGRLLTRPASYRICRHDWRARRNDYRSRGKIDTNRFTRPNRFQSIPVAESSGWFSIRHNRRLRIIIGDYRNIVNLPSQFDFLFRMHFRSFARGFPVPVEY